MYKKKMSSNETSAFSSSRKVPIFDGKDKSKFQEWADDMYATLQYYDLEEYDSVKGKIYCLLFICRKSILSIYLFYFSSPLPW